MLEDLTIKDFALITYTSLEVEAGFTVLSGETGAGKSILIGALSFLLGGKADVKMIRSGAHEASVAGTFTVGEGSSAGSSDSGDSNLSKHSNGAFADEERDDEVVSALAWLASHGIEAEDGRVLVRRILRESGKSAAWIGGVPVTRADLSAFSALLVDIHGQHEHQLLMKVSEHRKFLDAMAGIEGEVRNFTNMYAALVAKRRALANLTTGREEREEEVEKLSFAVQEIEEAKLEEGEDEKLAEEEKRLDGYEKLCADIEGINEALCGSCVAELKSASRLSKHAMTMDKVLADTDARLEAAFYEISDIAEEFAAYKGRMVFDPERLERVQDRLHIIYNLKKKYASISAPIADVIRYCDDARKELGALSASGDDEEAAKAEVKEAEGRVYAAAKAISSKRKVAGKKMASEVEAVLQHLGMEGTKFAVRVADKSGTDNEQKCTPYGMDDVEFLISSNPGSPLMPLAQIASGGELSRVMLALKTVIADSDPVATLVFDEIDTGIGGEVAVSVGEHLRNLARFKQILCITHLASIAVYADNQIKIEKAHTDNTTTSVCRAVAGIEREKEIARMLSGEESEAAVEHARAMLERCSIAK